ncbi:MAG: hypothetical protein LC795_08835 [Acidobacteria bacterium]|nr:hypothetical protein [Acidobacteriota bacterium]
MTKKTSLTFCAAALLAAGSLAALARAQKRAEAPAGARHAQHDAKHGDAKHGGAKHDAARHDADGHAGCPLMNDGKAGVKAAGPGEGGKSDAKHGGGHDSHLAEVNARGARAMGFSQTETEHHFLLTRDGGVIQVETKTAADAANRERVRQHLAHVSRMFAAGDFDTPMLVHARTPPGADRMSRLKADITYAFEETGRGGRVRIRARTPEALAAVHEFLRFQIEDHQTGDPTKVK